MRYTLYNHGLPIWQMDRNLNGMLIVSSRGGLPPELVPSSKWNAR